MGLPKGFEHTAETRAKMSASAKQRWIDHPRSAESNAKISESMKERWDIHRHIEEVMAHRESDELNTLRAFSNTAIKARVEAEFKRFLEGGK